MTGNLVSKGFNCQSKKISKRVARANIAIHFELWNLECSNDLVRQIEQFSASNHRMMLRVTNEITINIHTEL